MGTNSTQTQLTSLSKCCNYKLCFAKSERKRSGNNGFSRLYIYIYIYIYIYKYKKSILYLIKQILIYIYIYIYATYKNVSKRVKILYTYIYIYTFKYSNEQIHKYYPQCHPSVAYANRHQRGCQRKEEIFIYLRMEKGWQQHFLAAGIPMPRVPILSNPYRY